MLRLSTFAVSSLLVLNLSTTSTAVLAATTKISFAGPPNSCLSITGEQTIIGKYVRPSGDKSSSHDGTTRGFEAAADTRAVGCTADYMSQTLYVTNTYAGKGRKTITQSSFVEATNSSYLRSMLVYVQPKTRNDPNSAVVLSNNPHCLRVARHVMKNGLVASAGADNFNWKNTFYGGTNNNC